MKATAAIFSFLLCALTFIPANRAWAEDEISYRERMAAIISAISADDREAVAASIAYPLKFWSGGEEIFAIGNPADLLANFDAIFAKSNKSVLLDLDTSEYARFTQGIMLGSGEIWFSTDGAKIRTLNFFAEPIALTSASFADAFRRSNDLGLAEFLWRGDLYATLEARSP